MLEDYAGDTEATTSMEEKTHHQERHGRRLLSFFLSCVIFTLIFLVGIRSSLYELKTGPVNLPQNPEVVSIEGHQAITTFLGPHAINDKDDNADGDFLGVRTLLFQLLHSPMTKLRHPIPVIVLVTPEVRESKRQRLIEDGAKVIEVETISDDRWGDTATKLRIFDPTVVPYEKVLFLDAGTVLTRPIDEIFHDQGVVTIPVSQDPRHPSDDTRLPQSFMLAASPVTCRVPGAAEEGGVTPSFGSGVFLYTPTVEILQYYVGLLDQSELYQTGSGGHDLLNYAHRHGGPMPWERLQHPWYVDRPEERDLNGQASLLKTKWWIQYGKSSHGSRSVGNFGQERRWEMEGYWVGRGDAKM